MVRLSQEGRTVVRAVRTLIFYIITYTDRVKDGTQRRSCDSLNQ
jgi:hypothetical protein